MSLFTANAVHSPKRNSSDSKELLVKEREFIQRLELHMFSWVYSKYPSRFLQRYIKQRLAYNHGFKFFSQEGVVHVHNLITWEVEAGGCRV